MDSARLLANRMEMTELFTAVMVHAKELMEVDRSTLFMVDCHAGVMHAQHRAKEGRSRHCAKEARLLAGGGGSGR